MESSAVVQHRESLPPSMHEGTPGGAVSPSSILALLDKAMDKGVPVESLAVLQTILERVSDRSAAREFAEALSRFQKLCPSILKNRRVKYATKDGGSTDYRFAELDHIARVIAPHLEACGLSYSWTSAMIAGANSMNVTCTLRHLNGHREASDFPVPLENNAKMSQPQKHGAALTYARRQSLVSVLGLTTTETDTDAVDATPITQDQADDLRALIEESVPEEKRAKFVKKMLEHAKADSIEAIPAKRLGEIIKTIGEYRAAREGGGQ